VEPELLAGDALRAIAAVLCGVTDID